MKNKIEYSFKNYLFYDKNCCAGNISHLDYENHKYDMIYNYNSSLYLEAQLIKTEPLLIKIYIFNLCNDHLFLIEKYCLDFYHHKIYNDLSISDIGFLIQINPCSLFEIKFFSEHYEKIIEIPQIKKFLKELEIKLLLG